MDSILTKFVAQNITSEYCVNLLQQRNYRLSKSEHKKLEHIIREYRDNDKDIVLGAITIYAIFYPNEAIQYAKQKGVFYYGNSWQYTEYCLDNLNVLSKPLQLPISDQEYLQEKANCRWLGEFYNKIEKRLQKDIRKHFKNRIQKKVLGQWLESNFVIEVLAFTNLVFRCRATTLQKPFAGSEKEKKDIMDYSNEEISDAASYLIYLFTDEKGFRTEKALWLDIDYVQSLDMQQLVHLACQRNLLMEWEMLVDYLGYKIVADNNSIHIYDATNQLEKSLRIGFIKTFIQRELFAIKDFESAPIGLWDIAHMTVKELGNELFEWCCEDKLLERYRMKFPELLLEPLYPKRDKERLELFREEFIEISFATHELTFKNTDIINQMVTEHCSVVDLILFKRFFIIVNFAQCWLFDNEKNLKKVIPSLVPVVSKDMLISLLQGFIGSREKTSELIDFLSWNGTDKLDLQYTPIIKMDNLHYYIATDILIHSNIVRNSLMLARRKKITAANTDGQNDPLEHFCQEIFKNCPYPYGIRSNVKYNYAGKNGEIDFLAWSDHSIYIFECKNSLLPADSHEIRATYEHIKKASQQLDLSYKALQSHEVQKTYFSQWGIPKGTRTIYTCILLGNRLFTVPNGLRHPVRYAYELDMVLTSGIVNSEVGKWSCWANDQFADEDLARFLSDSDPLSQSFIEAMEPYKEIFSCWGKHFQFDSYYYNSLLHLEKQDIFLRVIEKDMEARQKINN